MYNDDYRDFDPLDDFEEFEDLDDADEMVDFTPPFGCPFYRQFQFPGGGSPPPRPPMGPQGGPGGPGGPGGQQGGVPSGPPPNYTPSKSQANVHNFGGPSGPGGISTQAVDPRAIAPCRFRYVFIWPRNGRGFWAWLTFVGRRSVSGYRWNGRRWVYFGMDLRRIESFICY